jgi:hypothetical protein
MSDSSSDDEPLMSSPEQSLGDDDSDDVFIYQARKFQKHAKTSKPAKCGYRSPTSSIRRRRPKKMTAEDEISKLEKRKLIQEKKIKERMNLNDSDEDSVVELCEAETIDDEDNDSSIEVLGTPPKNMNRKIATPILKKPRSILDLLDDSSDEESHPRTGIPLSEMKGASKEAMEALQRSRQATLGLKRAQDYKAEDIYVEIEENDTPLLTSRIKRSISQPQTLQKKRTINLGKTFSFTFRVQLEINGKKQSTPNRNFTLRENEHLSILLEKFLKAHSLPNSTRVNMNFDGLTLDMAQTPAHYDMMDEDLIDISAKANIIPTKMSMQNLGPKFNVTLRRKMGKKLEQISMQIGQKESFQQLLDTYREKQRLGKKRISLHFDGDLLDLSKNPAAYDMEADDLVDVIVN